MKIQILKCTDCGAWYADRVGQTMHAEAFEKNDHPWKGIPEDVFWCREGGTYNPLNWVRASDVRVLANVASETQRGRSLDQKDGR